MNFFGLNSPVIFIISVFVLAILGPKRIEKGWLLFQRLLKFLLSSEDDISNIKSSVVSQINLKPVAIEVKEEEMEVKSEEPAAMEVKEEETEVKSEEPEAIEGIKEVKEEILESKVKGKKNKQKRIKKEI